MGKKSKKNKKKRQLTPPLSFLDKTIYTIAFILAIVLDIFLFAVFIGVVRDIAFSDPGAIAHCPGPCLLFAIPFILCVILFTLGPISSGFSEKRPLFGNPKIKYGEPPFLPDCFPLFEKNKYHVGERPSHKSFRRWVVVLCCVVFLISAALLPLSLYNRTPLYDDNSIKKFNIINQVTKVYTEDDFESITLKAQLVSQGKGGSQWESWIDIEMTDGKSIQFSIDDFNFRTPDAKNVYLDKMLEIKALFPSEKITIEGAENVGHVADEWDFTESQQMKKLEELFS